ncbi:MAG: MFS transporter [Verrucomicrobiota bacterium]
MLDAKRSGLKTFSWACFDFANSAYGTLIGTFVYATLFTEKFAEDSIQGTAWWGYAVAVSSLVIGLSSPPLGAIADAYGWKKRLMTFFIGVCSLASFALYFPTPEFAIWGLVLFAIGNVAVELAIVFNNAFLPEIAPKEKMGKISGLAWGFGYVGGLLCLGIALVGFALPEEPWFGLSKDGDEHVRATNLLVGLWVLVFSLPMLIFVGERRQAKSSEGIANVVRSSWLRLSETYREIRNFKNVFWLLFARLFYNDGLTTVFAFGAIYAAGSFGFEFQEILVFGIVLNVAAGGGAFLFSFFEDRIGSLRTILVSLVFLIGVSISAVLVESKDAFWVCGILLGIFIGPNQSASRAFMAKIVPEEKTNEFFGFFAFSGKTVSFLGPALCAWLTATFASQRVGMMVIPGLFLLGLFLAIWKVRDEKSG